MRERATPSLYMYICAHISHIHTQKRLTNKRGALFSEQYAPESSSTKKSARTRPRSWTYSRCMQIWIVRPLEIIQEIPPMPAPRFFDAHTLEKNYDDGNIMSHSSSGKDGDYFLSLRPAESMRSHIAHSRLIGPAAGRWRKSALGSAAVRPAVHLCLEIFCVRRALVLSAPPLFQPLQLFPFFLGCVQRIICAGMLCNRIMRLRHNNGNKIAGVFHLENIWLQKRLMTDWLFPGD